MLHRERERGGEKKKDMIERIIERDIETHKVRERGIKKIIDSLKIQGSERMRKMDRVRKLDTNQG